MVYTRIVQPGVRSRYWYTPGERTIFRVAGTIIPEVWHMMLFSAMLTYAVCLVYDPLRRAEKKASVPRLSARSQGSATARRNRSWSRTPTRRS